MFFSGSNSKWHQNWNETSTGCTGKRKHNFINYGNRFSMTSCKLKLKILMPQNDQAVHELEFQFCFVLESFDF